MATHDVCQVCLDDEGEQGDLSLTTNMSETTTAYPDTPKMHLEVSASGSYELVPVVWHLEWMNDASGLEWTALPRIGLVYPGFPIEVIDQVGTRVFFLGGRYRWGCLQ